MRILEFLYLRKVIKVCFHFHPRCGVWGSSDCPQQMTVSSPSRLISRSLRCSLLSPLRPRPSPVLSSVLSALFLTSLAVYRFPLQNSLLVFFCIPLSSENFLKLGMRSCHDSLIKTVQWFPTMFRVKSNFLNAARMMGPHSNIILSHTVSALRPLCLLECVIISSHGAFVRTSLCTEPFFLG